MIAKLETLKVMFTKTKTSTEHPQTMESALNNISTPNNKTTALEQSAA